MSTDWYPRDRRTGRNVPLCRKLRPASALTAGGGRFLCLAENGDKDPRPPGSQSHVPGNLCVLMMAKAPLSMAASP